MFDDIKKAVEAVHAEDAVLLDVRTHDEHKQESALKAVHIDVFDIEQGKDPHVNKDTPILIHCRSGGRADRACSILTARGYTKVQNVGGLTHWLEAGGKTS